jgi:flavin reductase (DIM6/NTAB) family NADH-FMN oxidoreductase RutF
MKKRRLKPLRPAYPSPAALVTSVDEEGRANIITLAEVFNISIREPVIVGIAIRPATYSHGLISKSMEYAVNFPTVAILEKVDACGSVSGRGGVDKFSRFGLTALPAEEIKAPLIAECPVNIECRVVGIQRIGDHDLFLGDVVAMHVDEDKVDEAGKVYAERLDCFAYVGRDYYALGKKIASRGFSAERSTRRRTASEPERNASQ